MGSSCLVPFPSSIPIVFKFEHESDRHRFLNLNPRTSDSIDLERGPVIYVANMFPGRAGAAASGTTLRAPLILTVWPPALCLNALSLQLSRWGKL